VNTFWNDRPVLVTGATGLLGSWLVGSLQDRGARIVALVRDLVPDSLFYADAHDRRATTVFGDLRDGRFMERVLVEHEIDAVFHLGAQTIVEHAVRDPASTFRSNIEGTWEVLDACRRSARPTRIVVASSDKAYGTQEVLPYTEDQPLQGRHPYDVSKSCADLIATSYAVTYGLPVVITRCGNLYGGGDLNFNRLVPGTIRSALDGQRPLLRSTGAPLRDYLYVEDAVEAYIALAQRAHEVGIAGEAWNFSTETPVSALEMARAVVRACGRPDLEPDVLATAAHEIEAQYLSAEKARRVLNWRAEHGLAEGLARTVAWYRRHLGRGLAAAA
jgi:CDP-glucose 4,6-dehydratase